MQGHKAMMLYILDRSEEALTAYERAIQLNPMLDWLHQSKGDVLYDLDRYEESLVAYEKAIQLDPNYFTAHKGKDNVLYELKSYSEALIAYNHAIQLNPKNANIFIRKGDTLQRLLESRKDGLEFKMKSDKATTDTPYCCVP